MAELRLPSLYRRRHSLAGKGRRAIRRPDLATALAQVARAVEARALVAVGAPSAHALVPLAGDHAVVVLDGKGAPRLRANGRSPRGAAYDLESGAALPLEDDQLEGAVLVCADVLQGLRQPDRLLAVLACALERAAALVIVTPDRDQARGPEHLGPPPDAAAAQEWTLRELELLARDLGLAHGTVGLTRADGERNEAAAILGVFAPDAAGAERLRNAIGWLVPALPARLAEHPPAPVAPIAARDRLARRVCVVSREYFEDAPLGGIGRLVSMEAPALAAAGAEVHLITLAAGRRREDFVHAGVHVHRLPQPPFAVEDDGAYQSVIAWSRAVAACVAELDAEVGFDVVEVPDYYAEGLQLALRPETGLAVTLHGLLEVISRSLSEEAPTPGARVWHGLEIEVLRRADVLIAPTALVRDDSCALLGADRPPAELLPHAFDASRFPERPRRAPADVLRLLFVGRVERRKGPDLALRAAAEVARRGRAVELTFLGRDWSHHREDVLEPLAEELGFHAYRFLGEVGEAEVAALLAESDCALMPSRWDNFHTSAVEALATGVPVITSDADGVTSWIAGEDGLLSLPVGDPVRFAELAAHALLDETWLREAGPRGAARVREAFAPERIGPALLDLYDGMLRRVRPRAAAVREVDGRRRGVRRDRIHRRALEASTGLDARSHAVVAFAEELLARPDLLGAYAAVLGGADDVTLVAISPRGVDVVGPELVELLDNLGLDGSAAPDILLHAGIRDDGATLWDRAAAVLTERDDLPASLAALPHVGVARTGRLREIVA